MRRRSAFMSLAIVLALAVGGYAIAQQMRPGPYLGPQMMAQGGSGAETQVPPGPGMWGPGGWGPMGYGMMGPGMMGPGGWGHMGHGFGMMGPGMMGGGMWGSVLGSPEIMGTMLSLRGEMMSLMGRVLQKYGAAMWQMTPDVRRAVQREVLEGMGEILARQGSALKKSAAAIGK